MRHTWMGVLLLVLSSVGSLWGQTIRVEDLRCEYLQDPLGIDTSEPRLSWTVQSQQRAQRQTAYEVLVASSPERLKQDQGDLWQSGKVASDETAQVVYGGKPLGSRQACFWKVRAWDRDGSPSDWSQPALWEMGLLKADDWKARWIQAESTARGRGWWGAHAPQGVEVGRQADRQGPALRHGPGALRAADQRPPGGRLRAGPGMDRLPQAGPLPGLRRRLDAQAGRQRAGRPAGQRLVLRPHRQRRVPEVRQDAGAVRAARSDLRRRQPASGSSATRTWKVHAGPMLASDFMLGESYDARREIPGWDQPGLDDGPWPAATVRDEPARELEGQVVQPVRADGRAEAQVGQPAQARPLDLRPGPEHGRRGAAGRSRPPPARRSPCVTRKCSIPTARSTPRTSAAPPSVDTYVCQGRRRRSLAADVHLPRLPLRRAHRALPGQARAATP